MKLLVIVSALMLSLSASAAGPQLGTVSFQSNSGSFELNCELDYAISTPQEQYVGLVCDDPGSFLQSDVNVGSADHYSIEDRTDGQLYIWTCPRKGRISVSHGEFIAVADCRVPAASFERR